MTLARGRPAAARGAGGGRPACRTACGAAPSTASPSATAPNSRCACSKDAPLSLSLDQAELADLCLTDATANGCASGRLDPDGKWSAKISALAMPLRAFTAGRSQDITYEGTINLRGEFAGSRDAPANRRAERRADAGAADPHAGQQAPGAAAAGVRHRAGERHRHRLFGAGGTGRRRPQLHQRQAHRRAQRR